jgi:cell division protein FtsQ
MSSRPPLADRPTERVRGRRPGPAGGGGRSWRLVRADTDAVPPSVRRFMARARQRRLRAALPWAVAGAVLLVAGAVAWTVYGTAVFGVRDVRVTGAELAGPLEVRTVAAVADRQPLALVDLDAVRARVEAIPPVDRAVVRRDWPNRIVIDVVERTPVAAVPAGTTVRLIDDEGVPFREVAEAPGGLPVVRLANPSSADPNTKAALTVLASLTDELRGQLLQVSVPAPARIQLSLAKGRTVIWGDDTENATKARVATSLLARKGDTIDVSAPQVVTIR